MRHGSGCGGTVPVFLPRRDGDDVARSYFLDLAAPLLCESTARCHYQGLTQRVCMPGGPSPRLESDSCPNCARGVTRFEKRINTHSTGEIISLSLSGRLGTTTFDFHSRRPSLGVFGSSTYDIGLSMVGARDPQYPCRGPTLDEKLKAAKDASGFVSGPVCALSRRPLG